MKIIIKRPGSLFDRIRDYTVILDGVKVGHIKSGKTITLDASQDEHELHLKIDWCTSNSITIQGDVAELHLHCYNTFAGWKALIPLYIPLAPWYYISFGRRNYLTLKKLEPHKSGKD